MLKPIIAAAALIIFVSACQISVCHSFTVTVLSPVGGRIRWKFSENDTRNTPFRRSNRSLHSRFEDEDDDDDNEFNLNKNLQKPPSTPKFYSYGLNGRSSPSQRKAMGKSSTSSATINVCTNCGAEYIKWIGQCLTCKEWNTIQEMSVMRGSNSARPQPNFFTRTNGSRREDGVFSSSSTSSGINKSASWIGGYSSESGKPVRITDIHEQMKAESRRSKRDTDDDGDNDLEFYSLREKRLVVPNNPEMNNVLGGGIMPGSLTLLGGDPGKSIRMDRIVGCQCIFLPYGTLY